MSRAVVDSLTNLLPACNGSPPNELVELAMCLLAQSRSQASNLKAEEEIARSYACAHLACERYFNSPSSYYCLTNELGCWRLKSTIKLTKVQPRPPCQPRIYQNLYRHFDAILYAGTNRRNRASKLGKRDARTAHNDETSRSAGLKTKGDERGLRKRVQRNPKPRIEAPAWVMPVIRQLCKESGASTASPHIFAGVSSILDALNAAGLHEEETTPRRNVSALIVSVYLFVVLRLSGKEIQSDAYIKATEHALQIVNAIKISEAERDIAKTADVDDWLLQIQNNNWTSLDWYRNVPCGTELPANDSFIEPGQSQPGDASQSVKAFTRAKDVGETQNWPATLRPGLGTMVCSVQCTLNELS